MSTDLRISRLGLLILSTTSCFAAPCHAAFTNVTASAIPGSGGLISSGKAAWADYNNDGWTDLNVDGRLLRNNRNGTFSSVGGSSGASLWGDYDNDGYVDLFQYDGGTFQLWHNVRGRSFVQGPTLQSGAPPSRGATWGDFDGDRYLDLYVGGYESDSGYHSDSIFTNNGNRTFHKTWTQGRDALTTPGWPRPARGVAGADFDRDGDMDVYVSNYRLEPNTLWRNSGRGSFADEAPGLNALATSAGYHGGHSIGAVWGDFNNDGEIDLFAGNFAHNDSARPNQPQSRFLKNRGPGAGFAFEDMGTGGVFYQESYASPTAGDIDNDGDLDLYFTTVYNVASFGVPNYPILYRNEGNFRFVDVTSQWGLPTSGSTYQGAFADYNNDGYLDLVTNGSLYRNTGGANNWVKIRFDSGSFRDATAIGAQVRIRLNGKVLTRQVEGAVGEGNQNDHVLHFGLGSFNGPIDLLVSWPNGKSEYVRIPGVNRTFFINTTGDYNGNDFVDGVDLLAWQRQLGSSGVNVAGDGTLDGVVDNADLDAWQARFGLPVVWGAPQNSGNQLVVPESLATGLALCIMASGRKRGRRVV